MTILGIDTDWELSPWSFNLPGDYASAPRRAESFLFTDRELYRPGETVRVKGIVRGRDRGGLGRAPLDSLMLKVINPYGDTVLDQAHRTLPFRQLLDGHRALRRSGPRLLLGQHRAGRSRRWRRGASRLARIPRRGLPPGRVQGRCRPLRPAGAESSRKAPHPRARRLAHGPRDRPHVLRLAALRLAGLPRHSSRAELRSSSNRRHFRRIRLHQSGSGGDLLAAPHHRERQARFRRERRSLPRSWQFPR